MNNMGCPPYIVCHRYIFLGLRYILFTGEETEILRFNICIGSRELGFETRPNPVLVLPHHKARARKQ